MLGFKFKVEMQLRRFFGKYRWFRNLTRTYLGWYWRKTPRDYTFEEEELPAITPVPRKIAEKESV